MKLNTNSKNQSLLSVRRNELIQKGTKAELHVKRLLEEIGDDYGLTKERIRQIKEKALRKLRNKSKNLFEFIYK